jgi:hypothetical protein
VGIFEEIQATKQDTRLLPYYLLVYCRLKYSLRAERSNLCLRVELGNKQIQICGTSDFGRLPIYVLCPRHFFINGSRTLAMCEIKCFVYFCPKKIGVSWLCTSNFGIGMYISVSPFFVVYQSDFSQISYLVAFNDNIFALFHVSVLGCLHTRRIKFLGLGRLSPQCDSVSKLGKA